MKCLAQTVGNIPRLAVSNGASVNFDDRDNLRTGVREKTLFRRIEVITRQSFLMAFQAQGSGQFNGCPQLFLNGRPT